MALFGITQESGAAAGAVSRPSRFNDDVVAEVCECSMFNMS